MPPFADEELHKRHDALPQRCEVTFLGFSMQIAQPLHAERGEEEHDYDEDNEDVPADQARL